MQTPSDTVEQYLRALYTGESDAARQYLADDLAFSGPSASFRSADAFVRASAHVAKGVRAVHTRKLFADGPDVGVFYELVLDEPHGAIWVADWYRLEGERIASIRTILDTAPFLPSRREAGETAIDPVCHMTVDKSAPAARRTHAGTEYYFCSAGCADAFEQDPDKYLAATS